MTELEQLRGEVVALREALTTIKTQYGQVCEEFMTCNHPACTSSYSCWATADEALASSPLSKKVAAALERTEKAEESGYRRGVEAAIEAAKQQRCRDEYPKTNREKISHERGCNGAIKRIRALLSPETQDETAGSVQEARK